MERVSTTRSHSGWVSHSTPKRIVASDARSGEEPACPSDWKGGGPPTQGIVDGTEVVVVGWGWVTVTEVGACGAEVHATTRANEHTRKRTGDEATRVPPRILCGMNPAPPQDLEATLLRIAGGARLFGLGWFVLLAAVAWLQHRDAIVRPAWLVVPALAAATWALISLVAVRRRRESAVAPSLLAVDTLIAAAALLAPSQAGIGDVLFYGGLPLIVVGIGAIRGSGAAWSMASALVLAVLVRIGVSSVADVVGSISQILTYVGGAFIFTWVARILRSSETARLLYAEAAARAEERAEISRHLHDSVLQTLALIQRAAADPSQVTSLARRQERDLREYLYGTPRPPDSGFADGLRAMAADVEDSYRVAVDVVTVGDAPTSHRIDELLAAAREATVNAAKHAEVDHVSVYGEVLGDVVTVYVRDRGKGFDPAQIGSGRRGIEDSILRRLEAVGGSAELRTGPEEGTEWRMQVNV